VEWQNEILWWQSRQLYSHVHFSASLVFC